MKAMFLLLFPCLAFGDILTEEQASKRVYAHLLIQDYMSAVVEAQKAVEQYPESDNIKIAYFRALCQKGDELEALRCFEKISPEKRDERTILEALGWGVLNKAIQSNQMEIRMNVLMAAAFTNDVKAIPLLIEEMRSSNAFLRRLAVSLAARMGDAPLQQEIARMLAEEKVWYVRLEVIQAIGRMQMKNQRNRLRSLLINPKTSLEERGAAQVALVNMYEAISKDELKKLIGSNRAALRQLGCNIVAHLDLVDEVPQILPLLNDSSSEVRLATLNTLGLMKVKDTETSIKTCLDDPSFDAAITAAWAMMQFDPKLGEQKMKQWLRDPNSDYRRMAAGALAICGPKGVPLAYKTMKESSDIYVKATLAMGLISQRKYVPQAQEVIYQLLSEKREGLWMWDASFNPLFRFLSPNRHRHQDAIPQFPKVVDQMVRLELLSLLCMTHYPKAEEAVRAFLKSHSWGVAGVAASILLGEGNEVSIEFSQKLLEDKEEKIRIQAAFILAVMGHDEAALPVLQEAYPRMDRQMKLQVLEAMAQVGGRRAIPFLLTQLKEPYQVLRVAAAAAIIQCIYH